ncbi:hypothetical protein HS041_12255 [Planomonospora sp. ID67723]|uniref:hypothetical protein n=1 Tax=Planomonospora sp. ID67723 TaxID=2738134 RepID=UPI0018C388BC|nr:hypothetical protein [Planomonospora sp. ID67723]MBG0828541.1 hypothetical protein [Planomonospora sp. ID67723]
MAASVRSVSTATGTSTTITVTKPTGTASGDLLVASFTNDFGAFSSIVAPSGWTVLDSLDHGNNSLHTVLAYKVAGGSEPASYDWTQAVADAVVIVVAVQGADTTPVLVEARSDNAPGSSHLSASVTPTGSDDLELRFWGGNPSNVSGVTWTPPAGYTEIADTQATTWTSACAVSKQLSSSAATGSQTATTVASFDSDAYTVAIKSAAGGGGTVTLGRATETDTGRAVTLSKTLALGRSTETDTANPVTVSKTITLGQAVDATTARPLTVSKSLAIGRASETTTAQPVIAARLIALGRATETTTAGAVTVSKAVALGRAVETSTAQAVIVTKALSVGQAFTTDTARPLTVSKTALLGRATEQTTAMALTVTGGAQPAELPLHLGGSVIYNGYGGSLV